MQRVRRVASVVVVAALGVSVLTGCRSDPSVAAYVGGDTISLDKVDAVYDDAEAKLTKAIKDFEATQPQDPASPAADGPVEMPITRQDVVTILVGREVLRRLAEEKSVSPAEVPIEQLEQSLRLPRDAEYVKAYADFQGYFQSLAGDLPARELTTADLREVYDRIQRGGGMPGLEGSFAHFTATLDEQSKETLARALAVRDLFHKHVEKVNAVVNPRYGPAEVPLVQGNNGEGKPVKLVVLSFSVQGAGAPVIDAD